MTSESVTHKLSFNIYFVLTFIIGCFALLNTTSLPTAGAFMGWSLLFGLAREHVHNNPDDRITTLLHKF